MFGSAYVFLKQSLCEIRVYPSINKFKFQKKKKITDKSKKITDKSKKITTKSQKKQRNPKNEQPRWRAERPQYSSSPRKSRGQTLSVRWSSPFLIRPLCHNHNIDHTCKVQVYSQRFSATGQRRTLVWPKSRSHRGRGYPLKQDIRISWYRDIRWIRIKFFWRKVSDSLFKCILDDILIYTIPCDTYMIYIIIPCELAYRNFWSLLLGNLSIVAHRTWSDKYLSAPLDPNLQFVFSSFFNLFLKGGCQGF